MMENGGRPRYAPGHAPRRALDAMAKKRGISGTSTDCGAALAVPKHPPALWCEAHRMRLPKRCGRNVLCVGRGVDAL